MKKIILALLVLCMGIIIYFFIKEQFKNQYQPADLPLPAILLSNENGTQLLVSAAELNEATSLETLIQIVRNKLADR